MSSDFGIDPYEFDLYSGFPVEGEVVEYLSEETYVSDGIYYPNYEPSSDKKSLVIIILGVIVGIGLISILGGLEHTPVALPVAPAVVTAVAPQTQPQQPQQPSFGGDALTFIAPYTDYSITQGIHGMSYGHMAIDIAAGRGAAILSPINGVVTQLYMDEYGNPTILIENDVYQVTFLHGDYSVALGDELKAGQVLGAESNKGYTMDMAGNLCYNREWCGNHSHLNVFDKRIQSNVNPLDLFGS